MSLRGSLIIIVISCLVQAPGICLGQTLLDLYVQAKAVDPKIKKAKARIDSEQENYILARAQLFPRVDASSGISTLGQNVDNYSSSGVNGGYDGYNYGVNLKMPVINGPAWVGLTKAEFGFKAAEAALSQTCQDLMLNLADAYLSHLKAKAREQIAIGEKERLAEVLEQSKAFLESGTGDIIAVYEAQSRYDMAVANLNIAQSERIIAEQKLSILAGAPVTQVADITPSTAAEPLVPDDLNQWLAITDQNSPAIKAARLNIDQADTDVTAADRGHWPTIDFVTGYSVNKGSTFIPRMIIEQWTVGASLVLPIFHGGATAAQKRQAVAVVLSYRAALDETVMDAQMKTEAAFQSLKSSYLILRSLTQITVSSEKQLEAVRMGRTLGTRTSVDLLNAEQNYTASLRNLASFGYDHILYRYRLKAAAGILSEVDFGAPATGGSPVAPSEQTSLK